MEDLSAEHRGRGERVVAASGVSFIIRHGECVALVGESGSGKTTVARTIAGLHPLSGGTIRFQGEVLAGAARARTRAHCRLIQIVSQNPAESLNPRHTVARAVGRPLRQLRTGRAADWREDVVGLLARVNLAASLADCYPSELSGGERQRVAIARALAAEPQLLVCDEITSALDVSVQATVLGLLDELHKSLGIGVLFITHDLGVAACVADRVLVLEHGRICEEGRSEVVLQSPSHSYTRHLVAAAPSLTEAATLSDRKPAGVKPNQPAALRSFTEVDR